MINTYHFWKMVVIITPIIATLITAIAGYKMYVIKKSDENSTLEQLTGGETFAYLTNYYWGNDGIGGDNIELVINLEGNTPIYDLNISIYEFFFEDLNADYSLKHTQKKGRDHKTASYKKMLIAKQYFGTLHQNPTRELFKKITLTKQPLHYYIISLRARNGEVQQHLAFSRNGNIGWYYATIVCKFHYNYKKNRNQVKSYRMEKIYEEKNKGFPFDLPIIQTM